MPPGRQVRRARPTVQLRETRPVLGPSWRRGQMCGRRQRRPGRGRGLLALMSLSLFCPAPAEPDHNPVLPFPDALGLYSDTASDCLLLCLHGGPLDQVSWGLLSKTYSSQPFPVLPPPPSSLVLCPPIWPKEWNWIPKAIPKG